MPLLRGALLALCCAHAWSFALHASGPRRTNSCVRMLEEAPSKIEKELLTGVVTPTNQNAAPAPFTDPIAARFRSLFAGSSGKQIFFGVLQRDVDPSSLPSEEEQARRRQEAAASLTNIDMDERERRKVAGSAFAVVTAALAVWMLATDIAPLARAAIGPPLFLSYGYLKSYEEGL